MKGLSLLKKIQRSSDKTKRRIYLTGAVISMTLVISLWFIYISYAFPNAEVLTPAEVTSTPAAATDTLPSSTLNELDPNAGAFIKNAEGSVNGFKAAFQNFFGGAGAQIQKTNDIVVESPDNNFYFEGSPTIPTTTLPIAPKKK